MKLNYKQPGDNFKYNNPAKNKTNHVYQKLTNVLNKWPENTVIKHTKLSKKAGVDRGWYYKEQYKTLRKHIERHNSEIYAKNNYSVVPSKKGSLEYEITELKEICDQQNYIIENRLQLKALYQHEAIYWEKKAKNKNDEISRLEEALGDSDDRITDLNLKIKALIKKVNTQRDLE